MLLYCTLLLPPASLSSADLLVPREVVQVMQVLESQMAGQPVKPEVRHASPRVYKV